MASHSVEGKLRVGKKVGSAPGYLEDLDQQIRREEIFAKRNYTTILNALGSLR